MTKRLRANTIIPTSLYVKRAADRQLRMIIEEMGRPGYVLVARQMGKTNLLLNAKRELSSEKDVFAYLDVSNTYPDLRSFFRNITDVILESSQLDLSDASTKIHERRQNNPLLPHKEHENELRTILRSVPGKLVICLDEIDALTKTPYSDQIFSLIRSIYFSGRANFPEFWDLTFILSGVAEPTEIIKNKEISPFNIGEKIYLDDFSEAEFLEFLQKAGLSFDDTVVNKIYDWTGGNPRITWDLCSAVEDRLINGETVDSLTLESLVQKMYLTTFDLPPVDHIRTLVEDDKDIRAAVMAIHYNKSESISDPIKNKLYLAGISKFDPKTKQISIKNRIISHALSEAWIHQVDRAKSSIEDLAKMHFDQGNYKAALSTYTEFVNKTTNNPAKELPYYYMGLSAYYLRNYSDAINYLTIQPLKKGTRPRAYILSQKMLGLAQYFLGRYESAASVFEAALEATDRSEFQYEFADLKTCYATAISKLDSKNYPTAIELYQEAIELSKKSTADESKEHWPHLISLTRSNLAGIYRAMEQDKRAMEELELAVEISEASERPGLLVQLATLVKDESRRSSLIESTVACILDNKLPITQNEDDLRQLTVEVFSDICVLLDGHPNGELLPQLVDYLCENLSTFELNSEEIADKLTARLLDLNKRELATLILDRFLAIPPGTFSTHIRRKLLAIAVVLNLGDLNRYEHSYLEQIRLNGFPQGEYDYGAIYAIVVSRIETGEQQKADEILKEVLNLHTTSEYSTAGNIVIRYLEALVALSLGITTESLRNAGDFIASAKGTPSLYVPFFGANFPQAMQQHIGKLIRNISTGSVKPIVRTEPKYGRNQTVTVQFRDGRTLTGKFKVFSSAIASGECEIVT